MAGAARARPPPLRWAGRAIRSDNAVPRLSELCRMYNTGNSFEISFLARLEIDGEAEAGCWLDSEEDVRSSFPGFRALYRSCSDFGCN